VGPVTSVYRTVEPRSVSVLFLNISVRFPLPRAVNIIILYHESFSVPHTWYLVVSSSATWYLKKNQTAPRPSEHPPVMGEKMSKRLGGIKRLQIQNHFMAFKQVPRCR
ncbi:unnamed protein product, partial [Ascophyllum nodosum]